MAQSVSDLGSVRHMGAWLLLVSALAVHVVDEALTDVLGFHNPLVLSIRSRIPWFPMPTFTFGVWLVGLLLLGHCHTLNRRVRQLKGDWW